MVALRSAGVTVDDDAGTNSLLAVLRETVGRKHVLTSDKATSRYRTGYRFGRGEVLAVVRPGSLVEQWRTVKACLRAHVIVIMQAANTGLTGGSTPRDEGYDRPVVLVSTGRLKGVQILEGGRQVVCLPGATLYELERALAPFGRQPHSVIGSSCIGASVIGGVSNNSGGALVQRGPAYTELALYAQADEAGEVRLVNHLGIELGNDAETILARLENGDYGPDDVRHDPDCRASDHDYVSHVRCIDAPDPARFNADPARLHEASGSAGRLVIFAVRLDSFPADDNSMTFYLGTQDPDRLETMRREILAHFEHLPISAEYIHRTAFDVAAVYGKDSFLAIRYLGTDRLPLLFAWKARVDRLAARLGLGRAGFSDRALQALSRLFPQHLPRRMREFRDLFEHHLILKVSQAGCAEALSYLSDHFSRGGASFFQCSSDEARDAFLHRFAVAGAAVRYRAIHPEQVEDIVAIDVALPRNATQWVEQLPPEIERHLLHKLYYGHFLCHVFHQDYIAARGSNPHELEQDILRTLDRRGGEYPAEHNVGHLYEAKPALAQFYRQLDPGNHLNPGIGKTSAKWRWALDDDTGGNGDGKV